MSAAICGNSESAARTIAWLAKPAIASSAIARVGIWRAKFCSTGAGGTAARSKRSRRNLLYHPAGDCDGKSRRCARNPPVGLAAPLTRSAPTAKGLLDFRAGAIGPPTAGNSREMTVDTAACETRYCITANAAAYLPRGSSAGRRMVIMKELDDIDRQLLAFLQKDDRLSLAELGKGVGLAASSVNERVKRLVTRGVIEGFHAHVVPEALGLELLAFVFVGWSDPDVEAPFLAKVHASAAVLECHHVTGSWNYLLKVRLPNTRDLERFLANVIKTVPGVQRTETIIALSSSTDTTSLTSDPLASG